MLKWLSSFSILAVGFLLVFSSTAMAVGHDLGLKVVNHTNKTMEISYQAPDGQSKAAESIASGGTSDLHIIKRNGHNNVWAIITAYSIKKNPQGNGVQRILIGTVKVTRTNIGNASGVMFSFTPKLVAPYSAKLDQSDFWKVVFSEK